MAGTITPLAVASSVPTNQVQIPAYNPQVAPPPDPSQMVDPDKAAKTAEDALTSLGLHPNQAAARNILDAHFQGPTADPSVTSAINNKPAAEPAVKPLIAMSTDGPVVPNQPTTPSTLQISPPSATVSPFASATDKGIQQAQNEHQRLIDTGSGISQIKNPLLRGLATAGQIAGQLVAPGIMPLVPGTEQHHDQLIRNQQALINHGLDNDQTESQTQNQQQQNIGDQIKNEAAQQVLKTKAPVEITHDMAQEIGIPGLEGQTMSADQFTAMQGRIKGVQQKADAGLEEHGLRRNAETGAIEPIPYSDMTPQGQAKVDLTKAQTDLASNKADLEAAKNDPSSPEYRLAYARYQVSLKNAGTAAGKLGNEQQKLAFEQERFYYPQPTATERRTADFANSALDRINEMQDIINRHPEYFGPGAGRATDAAAWLGSSDPDAAKYRTAGKILADHDAAQFGGRGAYIIQSLSDITNPRFDPGALTASLGELKNAATGFQAAGQLHHQAQSNVHQDGTPPSGQTPKRPDGVPANAVWNPKGNHGGGSWQLPAQ